MIVPFLLGILSYVVAGLIFTSIIYALDITPIPKSWDRIKSYGEVTGFICIFSGAWPFWTAIFMVKKYINWLTEWQIKLKAKQIRSLRTNKPPQLPEWF